MATVSGNIASYNSDHSYYALSNVTNAYHDSSSTSYASVNLTRGSRAQTHVYWEFSLDAIPNDATINSITCHYKARVSNSSTSYISAAAIQLCSGTTTKGDSKSIRTTSTAVNTIDSPGTWTAAEVNAGVKLLTTATRGTSRTTSNYYIYFYGADIEIEYTEASGNKVFVKSNGTWVETEDVLVKQGGSWVSVSKVMKKSNGAWEEQDKSAVFDPNAIYIN